VQRRSFLKGAGIVTVAVVGGDVWRAWDQGVFSVGEGPAYEPWKDWRKTGNDAPLALVRAAILAASPHKTQPWLFKITNSSIELHIDTQRNVDALDPYLREEQYWHRLRSGESSAGRACQRIRSHGRAPSGKTWPDSRRTPNHSFWPA